MRLDVDFFLNTLTSEYLCKIDGIVLCYWMGKIVPI